MKIVAFSDLHDERVTTPKGDIGIFPGDYQSGSLSLVEQKLRAETFFLWFSCQPFERHIYIPGNHDEYFWSNPTDCKMLAHSYGVHLLDHSFYQAGDYRIFGSPYFYSHKRRKDNHYTPDNPNDCWDILVTHVPPKGVLDYTLNGSENVGSETLRDYIDRSDMTGKIHIFGHVHENFGSVGKTFYNVSMCSFNKGKKEIINTPVEIYV